MKRIAALDFGKKRIGVALSDDRQVLASPLQTLENTPEVLQKLSELFVGKEIELLLIGFPLKLDGTKGEMALLVESFAEKVEKFLKIPVVLVDERFSSKEADRRLRENSLRRKQRDQKKDQTAAAILLQGYLDRG